MGKVRVGTVAVVAATMSLAVVAIGSAAFIGLDDGGRRSVLGKISELSYQFVVIVLLGALLKMVIDEAQERRRTREALRDQQTTFVRRLIDVSQGVDLARVLILANRSVKTWSEQMNQRVIVAHAELRNLRHDERTSTEAGVRLFASWTTILPEVEKMERYLCQLIDEFADSKKALAELQREAELERSRQEAVWERMRDLHWLGDIVEGADGYGRFREAYDSALTKLRIDIRMAHARGRRTQK